jgi:hypothetical protein
MAHSKQRVVNLDGAIDSYDMIPPSPRIEWPMIFGARESTTSAQLFELSVVPVYESASIWR